MQRHLAKVSAAAVTIIVTAVLLILTGFSLDLVWLVGPLAGLAWVTYQATTAALQRRAPGQQTLSFGSMESVILIGSLLAIIIGYFIILSRQDRPAPPPTGVPGLVPFTAEELALPELDEEEVTRKIKELPLADGWRLLPVVQHRYPPYKSRRTVIEKEYDPRTGSLLIPLDLSLLEGGTLKARRKTHITYLGDIFLRHPPYYEEQSNWRRLGYPGPEYGEPLQLSHESRSAWFEPGERASSTTSPALIEVVVEPRSDLHAIWVKTEKELPPGNTQVVWGVLPGNFVGYRPLKEVSVLVQAFEPGGEGKPLSADFLQQLATGATPGVVILEDGQQREEPLDSSASYRLEYDPNQVAGGGLIIGVIPRTGGLTCKWRICVRCDWYTE